MVETHALFTVNREDISTYCQALHRYDAVYQCRKRLNGLRLVDRSSERPIRNGEGEEAKVMAPVNGAPRDERDRVVSTC